MKSGRTGDRLNLKPAGPSIMILLRSLVFVLSCCILATGAVAAIPRITPFQQAVARAAAPDDVVAAIYRGRGFAPIWSGVPEAARRRAAFLGALDHAAAHGLPGAESMAGVIRMEFRRATGDAERGALDVLTTRRFLDFAQDVSGGVLTPADIDPAFVLEPPRIDAVALIDRFTGDDPGAAFRELWPSAPGYERLLAERMRLRAVRAAGGWGPPVPTGRRIAPGETGPAAAALRARLSRMGYLSPSAVAVYDAALEAAIRDVQRDHGLTPDGIAGEATLEAINVPLDDRLDQISVGLERRRWLNKPLGGRHILVNLAEQRAYVLDQGRVTFDTAVVIGADAPGKRTPEFSRVMTHMTINPYWHVPRSITVSEYLPALRRGGARHLEVHSARGRIDRRTVDFSRYDARNFPFSLKQPPGPRNALGRVKFMFPNPWNIYLHDTPARSLFAEEVRTFSHGCVRVARPVELAYHLLAPQEVDPVEAFQSRLRSGRERRVDLEAPINVHLVYWSVWIGADGRVNYRGDPYGRDAAVLAALRGAGVALPGRRS
jgi:murein L,D-transpeptidase YcbB/YkuD